MAVLVPDKKLDHFCLSQIFSSVYQNNLAYHLGPVSPPGSEGSPLRLRAELVSCAEFRVEPYKEPPKEPISVPTCGDGSCVVADVSPTATQVDKDLELASSLVIGIRSEMCMSDWDFCSSLKGIYYCYDVFKPIATAARTQNSNNPFKLTSHPC